MPVHLADLYYDAEKDYCGLYVVSRKALPQFGPTAELIKILDQKGVVLLNITTHQKDDLIYDFVVIDLTGMIALKDEIRKEIIDRFGDKLVYLECVESGAPGFMYNVRGYPLILKFENQHLQVAALTAPVWKMLIKGMVRRFGTGASMILWYMGNDAGEGLGKILVPMSAKLTNLELVRIGLARLQSLGWGRFELVEGDEAGKRLVIRAYDNFEEMITKEILDYQNNFLRGFFVGLVSKVFDKACRGMETKCANRGDPYCEFLIR